MISTFAMIVLLMIHWVADFLLQTDAMALGKSKAWGPLISHTSVYSVCFIPLFGVEFALITFLLHTATDYVTSRITSRLWFGVDHGEDPASGYRLVEWTHTRHNFFVMIGLDQLIHMVTLVLTLQLLS